jgi:Flp pilus assembly secretin CpaC
MLRAFAVCAVILVGNFASAQSVRPRIVSDSAADEKLGIKISEPTPASECGEDDCPAAEVAMSAEKPADKHTLLKQKLAELNCLQSEIDQLRAATGTPQQILVRLQLVEVSRTKLQKSGIDITTLRGNDPAPSSGYTTINDTASAKRLIEKLRGNNIAKVLAEPTVVVVCGRPASLNFGGEVPFPLPPGSKQAVEFKQFGTQLDVLAIAQGDDRVRLELRARVSELDHEHEIEVGGVRVPGLQVRQIDTGLDLKFGQTGVLSGLVKQRVEARKVEDRVVNHPEATELLFLVTPEFVAPIDRSVHASTTDAGAYHTATSASEARPGERSVRVVKPSASR